MRRNLPFKHHRLPRGVILRYPLSYQNVVDLLVERGVKVDRSTVCRRVQKFGPHLTERTERHLHRASFDRHVGKIYIRVGGNWRYLWPAVDANGQMIDFRLIARRDAKAAKAFLDEAIERVRKHRTVTICADKAPTCRSVIRVISHRYDPHFDGIRHIAKKSHNNLIEAIGTIKRGHIHNKQTGV